MGTIGFELADYFIIMKKSITQRVVLDPEPKASLFCWATNRENSLVTFVTLSWLLHSQSNVKGKEHRGQV